jgi:elongator complex protein 1
MQLVAGQSTVLLYTIGNYHWYLKQRIDLCAEYHPAAMSWDLDSGNRLHIICKGSKYIIYDFSWRVDHSNGMSQNDDVFVGVIDGGNLALFCFLNFSIRRKKEKFWLLSSNLK